MVCQMFAAPFLRCLGGILLSGVMVLSLRAEPQHLVVTGSQHLRISYDTSFTWPAGSGLSAVLDLPVPPETGAQHIESFSSSIKGRNVIDAEGHRLLVTTIHPGAERHVHWHVEITGVFQTRQLVTGAPSTPKISSPAPGQYLASTESIDWKNATFQDWLDRAHLRRASGESAAALGRRIYDYFRLHGGTPTRPSVHGRRRHVASGCAPIAADFPWSLLPPAAPTGFPPASW